MCGCEAHRSLVDCTCDCDHSGDRISQWKERALAAEANAYEDALAFARIEVRERLGQLRLENERLRARVERKAPGRRHWKWYIDGNHCAECSKYVEEGVGEW
jgi:uncharacterized small protein (DUF1192 family)